MTRNLYTYLLSIAAMMLLAGCADEADHEPLPQPVSICVRAVWQDGRQSTPSQHVAPTTRSLTATDLLTPGQNDINIGFEDYPATIDVHCSDGNDLTFTKGVSICAYHHEFWSYTPSRIYTDRQIRREGLTFTASAIIDNPDPELGDQLTGTCNISDLNGRHLQLTLHHTKALLRFAFKVSEKYDKVRYILVTGIKLNGTDYTVVPKVLNTSTLQSITYCYLNPETVNFAADNTIECTYSIYDKDASFPSVEVSDATITANATHLTRDGVKAQNTFHLNILKDTGGNAISTLQAGYYYDLNITINPDYLYVLSDHDNQHITID